MSTSNRFTRTAKRKNESIDAKKEAEERIRREEARVEDLKTETEKVRKEETMYNEAGSEHEERARGEELRKCWEDAERGPETETRDSRYDNSSTHQNQRNKTACLEEADTSALTTHLKSDRLEAEINFLF